MRKFSISLLIAHFFLLASLWAAPAKPEVKKYVLSNGMRVLLYPRHNSPGIAFRIFYRVGSADEEMGQTGLAHMFEHMAFKGTKTINTKDYDKEKIVLDEIEQVVTEINKERSRPGEPNKTKLKALQAKLTAKEKEAEESMIKDEYEKLYESNGAWGFNAFTSNDLTGYTVSLPSNRLDVWLTIESDRFQNGVLREFYRERNVVMEERRMRTDSDPMGKLDELFTASAFTMSPYHHPVIGWMSDLERFNATQAKTFFDSRYVPSRCVIAIVGDIDPEETLSKIKESFEKIPAKEPAAEFSGDEPAQRGEKRFELLWDAEPSIMMGWHKPNAPNPDDAKLALLAKVLSQGRTSRFYKNLVEKEGIAQSVDTYHDNPGARYPNIFTIVGYPRAPYSALDLEKSIDKEIDAIKKRPPEDWELNRVINNTEAGLINTLEQNEGIADTIAYNEVIYENWAYSWDLLSQFEKMKPQDLSEAAQKYLIRENKIVGFVTKTKRGNL